MISQVESFLFPDKQGTPEEGRRIQRLEHWEKTIKTKTIVRKLLLIKKNLICRYRYFIIEYVFYPNIHFYLYLILPMFFICLLISISYFNFHVFTGDPLLVYNILYKVLLVFYIFLTDTFHLWNKIPNHQANRSIYPRFKRQNMIFSVAFKI